MAPIRIGFIGLSAKGWAATALVNPLFDPLLASSYSLTALCTTSETSAHAAAEKYSKLAGHGVKAYFGEDGVHAIARDPDVDLVAISVKMPQHFKTVMPAIEAEKDIFIEWTPGVTYEDTVKIAEAAKRKGVRVLVGAQGIQSQAMKKLLSSPAAPDTTIWTDKVDAATLYTYDVKNGASPLAVPVGHFLTIFTDILGDFAEVTASGAIQYPTAEMLGTDGKPTGEIITKTVHDQVALSGVLASKDGKPGTFYNLHIRAALPLSGEYGKGRTGFKWIIDGEFGTIEVQNKEENGAWGAFVTMAEPRVLLNSEEVKVESIEADRLGNPGKAWLEFAKGKDGVYWDIEKTVAVHRVLDAALTSIQEGRRISLS
ncbi:hypothetical protein EIP86_008791 [Pleurotus ostreatoroseus]|nr:hypothetical protein EIP86_008791 [Pleurotus ostreatoroseus]